MSNFELFNKMLDEAQESYEIVYNGNTTDVYLTRYNNTLVFVFSTKTGQLFQISETLPDSTDT